MSQRDIAVFCTDGIAQKLLHYLDASSIESFIAFLGICVDRASILWIFRDEALWSQMLGIHYSNGDGSAISAISTASKCVNANRFRESLRAYTAGLRCDAGACGALLRFLAWTKEREWFDQHVVVIMGDTARMDPVSGNGHDELVTDIYIRKKGVRATSADFTWRLGPECGPEVSVYPLKRTGVHNSFVVHGRSTQMRSLIHFVGTNAAILSPWEAVCRTFCDTMEVIQREGLRNVAIVSEPSSRATTSAAYIGLREIQHFLMTEAWHGTVGIVCYEKEAFQAFKAQKEEVLASFGATRNW